MKKLLFHIHLLFYKKCPRKDLIEQDVDHWKEKFHWVGTYEQLIIRPLKEKPEYRNLFYYRLGNAKGLLFVLKLIAAPLSTLYIWTTDISGGRFIQHGFTTIIAAQSIGKHCSINQQVTIGYRNVDAPIIGDNVLITCGAKVLGDIQMGNDVTVGANAVVVKDVPDNVTVVGVPAYIVKKRRSQSI